MIYSIRQDRNGTLWLGTLDGLDTLDRVTGKFTCFRHDSSNPGSLVAPGVDAIYEDKTGTLWLGTQGGLDRYDPGSKSFVHYWRMDRTASAGDPIAFSSNHWIQMIYEDRNGILWLGTNGGPVAFDRTKDSFRPYSIMTAASDTLQNRSVSSVLEDESGTLWIGTWGDGLMTYDVQAEGFVPHHYEKLDPAAENNSSICRCTWTGVEASGSEQTEKGFPRS